MRRISIERTTTAMLRDAFRVDSQVPNAQLATADATSEAPRLPYWLYVEKSQATAFSRYDLHKMSERRSL